MQELVDPLKIFRDMYDMSVSYFRGLNEIVQATDCPTDVDVRRRDFVLKHPYSRGDFDKLNQQILDAIKTGNIIEYAEKRDQVALEYLKIMLSLQGSQVTEGQCDYNRLMRARAAIRAWIRGEDPTLGVLSDGK